MAILAERHALGSIRDILEEQTRILSAIYARLAPVRQAVAEVYKAEVFMDDNVYLENERVLVFLVAKCHETPCPESIAVSIPLRLIDECDIPALILWVREHSISYTTLVA